MCTDIELVFLVNELLDKKDQISIDAFSKWKNGKIPKTAKKEDIEGFLRVIKKALITERFNLLRKIAAGENGWQGNAWILERKFKEWNLKNISETDITTNGKDINTEKTVLEFFSTDENKDK